MINKHLKLKKWAKNEEKKQYKTQTVIIKKKVSFLKIYCIH